MREKVGASAARAASEGLDAGSRSGQTETPGTPAPEGEEESSVR